MRLRCFAMLIACTHLMGAHAAEPAVDVPPPESQTQGRALFDRNCAYCHGERGHATTLLGKRLGKDNAVLERRTNLSVEMIRQVVRHGINSMPWFRRAELSDDELDAIAIYLTRPRQGP